MILTKVRSSFVISLGLLTAILQGLTGPVFGQSQSSKTVKVAVLVYPGVELLDFSGPVEVFSNASNFQVFLVSITDSVISTKNNTVRLTPHFTIYNAPQPDILVVPGAPMDQVTTVYNNTAVLDWIKKIDPKTSINMSVCTGAFIISKAGLTHNKTITSHIAVLDSLRDFDQNVRVVDNTRFVEDGKLVTTAGISAGIDGALRIVEKIRGKEEAIFVTRIMQYEKWEPQQGIIIGQQRIIKPKQNLKKADQAGMQKTKKQTDPVCHMAVNSTDTIRYHYQGIAYGFCSAMCKNTFRADPKRYAKK